MRSGLRRRMDESDNRQKTRYERERARKKEVTTAVAGECRHTEKKGKNKGKSDEGEVQPKRQCVRKARPRTPEPSSQEHGVGEVNLFVKAAPSAAHAAGCILLFGFGFPSSPCRLPAAWTNSHGGTVRAAALQSCLGCSSEWGNVRVTCNDCKAAVPCLRLVQAFNKVLS